MAFGLGIVEGLTEFLPVSSTVHLRLAEFFLGLPLHDPFWKLFSIVIQVGAVMAVFHLYYARVFTWGLELFEFFVKGKGELPPNHPAFLLAIAFMCTVIPVLIMEKIIGKNLESFEVMGQAMVGGAIVLAVVDWAVNRGTVKELSEVKPWQAAVVGMVQVLSAVFPGLSRSMITLMGGQVTGMTRSLALEFSFLLSVPVLAAASAYELLKYLRAPDHVGLTGEQYGVLLIGLVMSFISARLVVVFFLNYVRKYSLIPFVIYRLIAGGLVLLFLQRLG